MIITNGSLAIDISTVKAISMEYLTSGRNLIFELNNLAIPVENPLTGEYQLQSFKNDPIIQFFETSDTAIAYFEEWVQIWESYKEKQQEK